MPALRRIDYAKVLANLGATDAEINDLLAEDDEDTDIARELEDRGIEAPRPAGQWERADLGERTCETCGAVVLELPHCSACGALDDDIAF
jgi:hypothetical protein